VYIHFTRHAKRRAKLYGIPEPTMLAALEQRDFGPGAHQIELMIDGFKFPIKLVLNVEGDTMTVVTNYPLKKGRKP
jgi:hypothetical protein